MRKLQPGEAGVPTVVGQRQVNERWETASNARQAQRWQATVYVRTSAGVRRKLVRVTRTRARVVTTIDRYTIAWNVYLVDKPLLRLPIEAANDGQRLRPGLGSPLTPPTGSPADI